MTTRNQADIERIRTHLQCLLEFYDTVHIFVTNHNPSQAQGTESFNVGEGNWYARYGQISEWVTQQDEFARDSARRQAINE